MESITNYIRKNFGVDVNTFLKVLEMSPGAEGYILGSIGELLFKEHAESLNYEVLRIKEKPDGGYNAKSADDRGDFYIRKKDSKKERWYVVECKGVKSNSEKRSGLIKQSSCINLLNKHSVDRNKHILSIYKSGKKAYDTEKEKWEKNNQGVFPKFRWSKINPGAGIPNVSDSDLGNILISIPNEQTVKVIANKVRKSFELREKSKAELKNIKFELV